MGRQAMRMPRTARATVGGMCYHVMNRGNRQAQVFDTPSDYWEFIDLMYKAQTRVPIALLAACLMPNHFHFVMRPRTGGDIGRWMHWLLTTHASRRCMRLEINGHVWQGRYKAFPIEEDEHLLTVMRYVERNALRAGLVRLAEAWAWGSLNWRTSGVNRTLLASSPISLPDDWVTYVNTPHSSAELEALRNCVNRQRPYGSNVWVNRMASQLGLESSLRPVGRPRKAKA
ncbi:MAG TPA: transposase [Gammaproteobacteria bacterium]|nr:transposase [Gammaproteobacteria bacterium]